MSFVVGGAVVPAVTFEVLHMCFECVVYHHNFLINHLHPNNHFHAYLEMSHLPAVSCCGQYVVMIYDTYIIALL